MPWSGLSRYIVKHLTRLYVLETSRAIFLIPLLVLLHPAVGQHDHSLLLERGSANDTKASGSDYRLQGEVIPLSYNLSLIVDMKELTTEGEVQIKLRVMQPTSNITLHANQSLLSIKHSEVRMEIEQEDSPKVGVVGHLDDRKERPREFYTVLPNQTLEPGNNVTLILPFTGQVGEGRNKSKPTICFANKTCSIDSMDMNGIVENQIGLYVSPDAGGGIMAVTQFEPMYA